MNYEKVSVNINDKNLAKIDLLIANDLYSNRSDFINSAIEYQLDKQQDDIDSLIKMNKSKSKDGIEWFIGVCSITKKDLEERKKEKRKIQINGFGVLIFEDDIDVKLVKATIKSVSNKIKIHGNNEIEKYFSEKK